MLEGETGPREMSKLQMANRRISSFLSSSEGVANVSAAAIDFKFQIDYSVAQSRL